MRHCRTDPSRQDRRHRPGDDGDAASLKHRGPDSTGFALYGKPKGDELVLRFKVAEQEDMTKGFDIHHQVKERQAEVDRRLKELGAEIVEEEDATEYAFRYRIEFGGDRRQARRLYRGRRGRGDPVDRPRPRADQGPGRRQPGSRRSTICRASSGTHAIGHTRMATESDVDIRSAHPYWAYPFADVSVVHNGQLTNYWKGRRALEHRGHRFMSNCDSELIAVYLADKMQQGAKLEDAMTDSIEELDGVFTYLVATADSLGMAKDTMAAKPMVLYESDDFIALASEEVAIRSIFPHEIDTFDPYEGEVRVWKSLSRSWHLKPNPSIWGCTPSSCRAHPAAFLLAGGRRELPLSRRLRRRFQQARGVRRGQAGSATEINLKLRELMSQGYGTIVMQEPRRQACASPSASSTGSTSTSRAASAISAAG